MTKAETTPTELIRSVVAWAETRPDVAAVALVGSHARGKARPDSDVDLMILVDAPAAYASDAAWVEEFGTLHGVEEWGAVTSVRLRSAGDLEVELGITSPAWARVDPVDSGTARVVQDGIRVLFDPRAILHDLVAATRP